MVLRRNPQGRIVKGETVPDPTSPVTASFSSSGPSVMTPDIMKPDVSAPGIDILAAYPPDVPPTKGGGDDRSVRFNVLSGTSMSCPHVAGAAAYVKTFHPDWSSSAVKSALMTTASKIRDTTTKGGPSGLEFSYGSGQINPLKAANPGLIYEITKDDYVNLLCSLGFDESSYPEMDLATSLPETAYTRCQKQQRNILRGWGCHYPLPGLPVTSEATGNP
ncbi:hypothetical protein CDL15_Pgr010411 [Punica granatum]|uniref:Peptidase S8/S53 domain-containing protein n=1 Tax=Punica granatum TaxID=22663 RepID=A0A218W2K7_PUNGR|nr:hypothetical protein CDL15_Pgr010411 [Punica granatum]